MRKLVVAICLASALALPSAAPAQIGKLLGGSLGMPPSGEATGKYRGSHNEIRAWATESASDHYDLYGNVIKKLAELTRDKGFPRFAITKVDCETMLMNNSPVAHSCNIIATMVQMDEVVKPKKGREVKYMLVADVLR